MSIPSDRSVAPTDLLGTWQLIRTVHDRRGPRREVHGTAELVLESPGRVCWRERGAMTWTAEGVDHDVPVERTLYVEHRGDGWWVLFADGRPFHPWAVGRAVEHPCGPDHYTGLVGAVGEPVTRWTVEWEVTGPAKDYRMTTAHSGRRTAPPHPEVDFCPISGAWPEWPGQRRIRGAGTQTPHGEREQRS